jgi:hypothetical protein
MGGRAVNVNSETEEILGDIDKLRPAAVKVLKRGLAGDGVEYKDSLAAAKQVFEMTATARPKKMAFSEVSERMNQALGAIAAGMALAFGTKVDVVELQQSTMRVVEEANEVPVVYKGMEAVKKIQRRDANERSGRKRIEE